MPRKYKVNIPKGTKCANGVECAQDLELDLDIPDITTNVQQIPTAGVSMPGGGTPQTVILQQPPPPAPTKEEKKEDPHDTLKKALPRGVNYAKCEGGDCGHKKLKNPTQTNKHKACPGCKNNSVPKNNDFCPTCGLDEEDKKFEEWEESEIEMAAEEEEDDE